MRPEIQEYINRVLAKDPFLTEITINGVTSEGHEQLFDILKQNADIANRITKLTMLCILHPLNLDLTRFTGLLDLDLSLSEVHTLTIPPSLKIIKIHLESCSEPVKSLIAGLKINRDCEVISDSDYSDVWDYLPEADNSEEEEIGQEEEEQDEHDSTQAVTGMLTALTLHRSTAQLFPSEQTQEEESSNKRVRRMGNTKRN
jgi:hypothetical protein